MQKTKREAEVSLRIPGNVAVTFDMQMFFIVKRVKLNLKKDRKVNSYIKFTKKYIHYNRVHGKH